MAEFWPMKLVYTPPDSSSSLACWLDAKDLPGDRPQVEVE